MPPDHDPADLERRHGRYRPWIRAALSAGVRVSVEGALPSTGPTLVVANHVTLLDPVLIGLATGRAIGWWATETLTTDRFWGPVHHHLGALPKARFRAAPAAVKATISRLRSGGVVGIFAEGERTWTGHTRPLLPGAARLASRAGVPLFAARLEGAWRLWPRFAARPRRADVRVVFTRVDPEEHALAAALATDPRVGSTVARGRLAEGLGHVLFACPACGDGAHEELGDDLVCACGLRRTLDGDHLLHGPGGPLPLEDAIAATIAGELARRPPLRAAVTLDGRPAALRLDGDRLTAGGAFATHLGEVTHASVEFRDVLDLRTRTQGRRIRFSGDQALRWAIRCSNLGWRVDRGAW